MSEAEWIAFLQRPEFPAFNRAMLDNPDDDLPRLVFADWMDENCPDVEVNVAVRASIRGLLVRWTGRPAFQSIRAFTRGRVFLEVGPTPPPDPIRDTPATLSEALWHSHWVERLCFDLVSARGIARWVSESPMEAVQHLTISGDGYTAGELAAVTHSPHLRRLLTLTLEGWSLADGSAAVLAHAASLAGLLDLKLDRCMVLPADAATLANSPYLCEAIRAQWR